MCLFDLIAVLEKYGKLIYNSSYNYIFDNIDFGDEFLDEKTFCLCR